MKDMELAQLILAKFCHDIAGSLGAIGGSIEYLEHDNEEMRKKATKLIHDGSSQAISRLKFFRCAYGFSDNSGESNLEEIEELASELLEAHKIILAFHKPTNHAPEVFICINTGRLLLCMIFIGSMALLHGGTIDVLIEKQSNTKKITIKASGQRIKIDEERYNVLCGEADATKPSVRNVHYYYTMRLLKQLMLNLTINRIEGGVEYIVE
jgi:histidine phosphotransferase ChpT